MQSKYILNSKVNTPLSYEGVIKVIDSHIVNKNSGIICTTNPEFLLAASKDKDFQDLINSAVLSVPDGYGIILALEYYSRLELYKKHKTLNRFKIFQIGLKVGIDSLFHKDKIKGHTITGVDLIPYLCSYCVDNNLNMFLLGGWPKSVIGKPLKVDYDLATKTKEVLLKSYPDLNIIGASSQYSFKPSNDSACIKYIQSCMNKSNVTSIDIILVAFNHKNQEMWLKRNMSKINASIGIGVGGSFDYISGNTSRPPKFIRNMHLEWLFRLFVQPYKLKRIIMAFLIFPLNVYKEAVQSYLD